MNNTFDQSDEEMLYAPPSNQSDASNSHQQAASLVYQAMETNSPPALHDHNYSFLVREPHFEPSYEPLKDIQHARNYAEFLKLHLGTMAFYQNGQGNHNGHNPQLQQQKQQAEKRKMGETSNDGIPVKRANTN